MCKLWHMSSTRRSGDSAARRRPSAKRIRAARAFSGLERPAFAKTSGIPVERLNYLENGKGEPSPEEENAIQRATGVPSSFLRHGFESDGGTDLDQLDRRLAQLGATVAGLTEDLKAATEERRDLERRLDGIYDEIEASIGRHVREAIEQHLPRRRAGSRSSGGGRRTP